MVSTTTRYACGERRISLQSTIEPGSPAPRWRMVVQRLTIDGRRASRATVDAFNLFLIDFPSPPDVDVECIGPRLRFNMTLYERGEAHRGATYEVETR